MVRELPPEVMDGYIRSIDLLAQTTNRDAALCQEGANAQVGDMLWRDTPPTCGENLGEATTCTRFDQGG
jgi:hypothetical protein